MTRRVSLAVVVGLVVGLIVGGVVGLAQEENEATDMDPSVFVIENESKYDFDETVEMIHVL